MGQPNVFTIAVVEDEQSTRLSIMNILRGEGYNVMPAEDGSDGLRIVKNSKIDLILSDIQMPVMDGMVFYEKVQEDPKLRHIPFIFLTSMAADTQKMRGRELGVDDYLTKPIQRDALLASIRGRLKRAAGIESSRAADIEELKKEVLKSLTDEVRIPVNIIRNISALLLDKGIAVSPQQLSDLLKSIKMGGDRLQRGLNDFILSLQIESGAMREQYESEKSPNDLSAVLNAVSTQSAPYAGLKKVQVVVNPPMKSPSVTASRKQLEQLLERLVYSAVALSSASSRVELSTEVGDRQAMLAIKVSGTGISKTDLPKIFDKFHTVRQPQEDELPIGLSLYNAKRLAEINKCDLTCVSETGVGTTFTVVLPLS